MCPGRTFTARMYSTAARVKELHYFTRLNKEFRSDLFWWHIFINKWNGLSFLHAPSCALSVDGQVQTDVSGFWGCGAFYSNRWFQYCWPPEWLSLGIMAKELVPIIISSAVWGQSWAKKRIEVKCDNQSLVIAINKGTARDSLVMHLLRCL